MSDLMDMELRKAIYAEVINIFFCLRMSQKQEIIERDELLIALFGADNVTSKRRKVLIDVLDQLEHEKKIKLTGGTVTHWNYRLTSETWADLSSQLKKLKENLAIANEKEAIVSKAYAECYQEAADLKKALIKTIENQNGVDLLESLRFLLDMNPISEEWLPDPASPDDSNLYGDDEK